MKLRSSLFGFDPVYLAQFAEQQQRKANELQAEAARAQRAADAARKELRRRRQGIADAVEVKAG